MMSDAAPAADRPPLVLLVDDMLDGRESCADYLRFQGFDVALAEDGVEAVERAFEVAPDLILMDVRLPRQDGLTATRILKADARTKDIPVIALTAHALETVRAEALSTGCAAVVTKPCPLKDLMAVIRTHLARPSAAGEE